MSSQDFKIKNSIVVDGVLIDVSSAANSGGIVYSSSTDSYVSSKGNIPVGVVRLWASGSTSPTVPEDYLICAGQSLLQGDYPELYAVIGNRYTFPATGTTFRLPDFNIIATSPYRFIFGIDSANDSSPFNQTANENTATIGASTNLSHTHTSGGSFNVSSVTSSTLSHSHTSNTTSWNHNHDFDSNNVGANTANSSAHTHGLGNASTSHDHNHIPGNNQPVATGGASGNHTHNVSSTNQNHAHTVLDGTHNHGNSNGPAGSNANSHSHSFTSSLSQISVSHTHTIDTCGFYFIIRYR
jgi:hypothetical protein